MGGIGAVWEQIDSRLKADEEKTIDGPKRTKQNKISYEAFKRAHERMSPKAKKKKTTEKMSYGIRGNPILLMNIFEILGIKGFSDLKESAFMKPDLFSKLVSLDSKMTDMKTRIEELSNNIEVYCKKKPRISTLKLVTDIDNITPRLYSIITKNTDPAFDDWDYRMSHTTVGRIALFGKNKVLIPNTPTELKKSQKQHQFNQGTRYADAILFDDKFGDEERRVLRMYNLLEDYKEYCSQEPLLRKYYRILQKFDFRSSGFKNWDGYILSPLYIACFYLQIVIRHLSRIEKTAIKTDEETEKKIVALENETNETNETKPIKYLRTKSSNMNNRIRQLLNLFNEGNIKLPNQKYSDYKKALRSIAEIYFKIFSENKNFTSEPGIGISYSLTIEIVNLIEIGINGIETLIRSTKRDINA
ncbi:hypothetical protein AGMMS49579_17720 [Spirochaetia bacterium]|nr:hypothetical protein AGMMS49579_17720 [Spirochaetia bacterium]